MGRAGSFSNLDASPAGAVGPGPVLSVLGFFDAYFALASAICCTCATAGVLTLSDCLGFGNGPDWLGSVVSIVS